MNRKHLTVKNSDLQSLHSPKTPRMEIDGISTSELHHVSGVNVRKEQFTHFGLVHELPNDDRNDEKRYPDIRSDEVASTPVPLQEDRKASDQGNDGRSDETIPRGKGLEGALPR